MGYENNKSVVLDLFENYINMYIIKDLKKLDSIKPDDCGAGACAIPQAISTFSALDLVGYLIHTEYRRPIQMSFIELLGNDLYFPYFKNNSTKLEFFISFKDDFRSVMVHRFLLTNYDITKNEQSDLFFKDDCKIIFNVSYFTKMAIEAIGKIYQKIKDDDFNIEGNTKEDSMKKIKKRIEELKDYKSEKFKPLENLPNSTTTTQTTSSLC